MLTDRERHRETVSGDRRVVHCATHLEAGVTMTTLTLGQAAKLASVGKTTLTRAIKSGRLSAERREDGSYRIDPAELSRAYEISVETPETVTGTGDVVHRATVGRDTGETAETLIRLAAAEAEIKGLREMQNPSQVSQACGTADHPAPVVQAADARFIRVILQRLAVRRHGKDGLHDVLQCHDTDRLTMLVDHGGHLQVVANQLVDDGSYRSTPGDEDNRFRMVEQAAMAAVGQTRQPDHLGNFVAVRFCQKHMPVTCRSFPQLLDGDVGRKNRQAPTRSHPLVDSTIR